MFVSQILCLIPSSQRIIALKLKSLLQLSSSNTDITSVKQWQDHCIVQQSSEWLVSSVRYPVSRVSVDLTVYLESEITAES
jgi:hypothetical protein